MNELLCTVLIDLTCLSVGSARNSYLLLWPSQSFWRRHAATACQCTTRCTAVHAATVKNIFVQGMFWSRTCPKYLKSLSSTFLLVQSAWLCSNLVILVNMFAGSHLLQNLELLIWPNPSNHSTNQMEHKLLCTVRCTLFTQQSCHLVANLGCLKHLFFNLNQV